MAISYFPFDAGAGANVTEDQWRKMARLWLETGVLADEDNEFEVSERAAGVNMSVDVATGKAWLRGHYVESTAVENKAITAAHGTLGRIDRVVLRADFTANTISVEVLDGTPDASPAAPALTQSASRWEISLAQVSVPAADTTIADAQITDERTLVSPVASGGIVELDYVEHSASTVAISSNTASAPDNVLSGNAVDYDGSTAILIEFSAAAVGDQDPARFIAVQLWDGATRLGDIAWSRNSGDTESGTTSYYGIHGQRRLTPTAGPHTYHIKAYCDSGGATLLAGNGAAGNPVPMFMRITRIATA